jgi:hypothetical protein
VLDGVGVATVDGTVDGMPTGPGVLDGDDGAVVVPALLVQPAATVATPTRRHIMILRIGTRFPRFR